MTASYRFAAAVAALLAAPALAQQAAPAGNGLGEVLVTANRNTIPYAQQDRPVVGLRRPADAAVIAVAISSDTREEATRKREIHAVLLAALARAEAAGLDLVWGGSLIAPVTRANYQDLPFQWAGRADTSKVDLMVRAPLAGSTAAVADKRLADFVKAVPLTGRGVIDKTGNLTLTVVDPDQYRARIIGLVADDARASAAAFGPDFAFTVTGIDGQVAWSQVSGTEVFLTLPYRYTIVPRR